MKERKTSKVLYYVSLLIVGMIIGCVVNFLFLLPPQIITIDHTVEVEAQHALLNAQMTDWGEQYDDSTKLLFNGLVYNYGSIEAQNVSITCKASIDGIVKKTVPYYIGNIASASYKYFTADTTNFPHSMDESLGWCYVSTCGSAGCVILDQNIPDMWTTLNMA